MSRDDSKHIPFFRSDISNEDVRAAADADTTAAAGATGVVGQYERSFSGQVKLPPVVAVQTLQSALIVSLKALGLKQDDEVILPAYTVPGVGAAVEHAGASSVFADVDPVTLNLSAAAVEARTGHKTRAVIVFDAAGLHADTGDIVRLATSNGMYVLHCTYYHPLQRYEGNTDAPQPHVTVFCNNEPSIKGALIATGMENTRSSMLGMAGHGTAPVTQDAAADADSGNWYYEIVNPGFDCRMTDLQASLQAVYTGKAGQIIRRREQVAQVYGDALAALGNRVVLPCPGSASLLPTWQLYIMRLTKGALRISRDEFMRELRSCGIETGVHYIPLYLHPYYARKYRYNYNALPVTYEIYSAAVCLPLYASLSDDDAHFVAQTVVEIIKRYST